MLTEERLDRIQNYLSRDGKVVAADLAVEFQVSEDTVRRDLRELSKAGLCRKVYGGALAAAPAAGPIKARHSANAGEKQKLAATAATLVRPGQTLFIDAGSTNMAIAQALPKNMDLTIVTNAPAIVDALGDHPACAIIMLGGAFNRDKGANLGSETIRQTTQIYADIFFVGACGVDSTLGVTALDMAEADVKRAMAEQSASLIVAATRDKLQTKAPFKICGASAITHLVIYEGLSVAAQDAFSFNGTTVHIAR